MADIEGYTSSAGKQTTAAPNTEFTFSPYLKTLFIKAYAADITIKLNGMTSTLVVEAGTSKLIEDFKISSMIIVENGVDYMYEGLEG